MQLKLKDLIEYLVVCTTIALVLSRILFVIALIPVMKPITLNELAFQLLNGGIVFYGGLFGVILGILLVSKYRRRNGIELLNTIAPAFPLFHSFARMGCLLAGCCYGIEWNWGVIMVDDPDTIRFPVQFVESVCNVGIFVGLMILENKKKTSKYNLKFYLCSYAICRFILEYFRGDVIRGIWGGAVSTAQVISLIILVTYVGNWLRKKSVARDSEI